MTEQTGTIRPPRVAWKVVLSVAGGVAVAGCVLAVSGVVLQSPGVVDLAIVVVAFGFVTAVTAGFVFVAGKSHVIDAAVAEQQR